MSRSQRTGRHPGKRLSPWRVGVGVGIALAVVAGVAAVPLAMNGQASAEPSAVAGPRWFGGYFDVTAAQVSEMPDIDRDAASNVVLAFVVAESADACVPSWGTFYGLDAAASELDLDRRIARMRQQGADIVVSFGGALNTELAAACRSTSDLVDAYSEVIDRYGISTIDLDIEGGNLSDTTAGARRAEAVAELQRARDADGRALDVWMTLPVATTGLTDQGLTAVEQMLMAGVDVGGVNVMTMDYGTDLGGATMAEASISALEATAKQLQTLYARHDVALPAGGAWAIMGATPMIGQNDVADEVFTMKDAASLNDFAVTNRLERLSMWSLNRDRTCGPNYPNTQIVSDSCSGVDQGDESFADVLSRGFGGRPAVEPTTTPAPIVVVPDDPETSPYPIWNPDDAYSYGVRVVWHGNVYAAKWWTRGGAEPDDPTQSATSTAWSLVGPVLPGDEPFTLPTAAPGAYPDWSKEQIYVAGDTVLYQGTPFRAQWWTQGDLPSAGITDRDRSPWTVVYPAAATDPMGG